MTWLVLGAMLPSLLITWGACFLIRTLGPRLGLVDQPGHRKVHHKPMPTSGGVAIWLGIVVPLALGQLALWRLASGDANRWAAWLPSGLSGLVQPHLSGLLEQSGRLWALLGGGTVLMILGLLDDRYKLDWRLRLGVQSLVATALVLAGWRMSLFIDLPILTGFLSVLWIVGLVNSFNMLDNMDGLSAGVATIAGTILASVMLLAPNPIADQPQLFVGGFLLVFVGSLLGFLWHNHPPARLFMGDTGSYLIGYVVAMSTLTATFAGENVPTHAIFAPLCVLAVPIYDMLTVLTIRLREGRSLFVGDKSHFSHRLVDLGMTKPQAVFTIYLTCATCGLGALLLRQVNMMGALIILLLVTCVLVLIGILETVGRRKPPSSGKEKPNGKT